MAAADTNADVHTKLCTYGIILKATCSMIIDNKGFQTLKDIGILESSTDVSNMSKRL